MKSKSKDVQLVLLRGLGRNSKHWGKFPQILTDRFARANINVRIDAIDLPGTGRYSEMKSPLSIPAISEFAHDKFLEINQRRREAGEIDSCATYIVALSLGGMVAADWLARWPENFSGAVLMNTSFKGFSPLWKRLQPLAYRHMFKILSTSQTAEREKHVLEMVSNRPDHYNEVAKEWGHMAELRPVSYENFIRQLFAAASFTPKLQSPPVPVLILTSLNDRMVDSSCSEIIADRWHAELERHTSAGHDLALDAPDWVAEQIVSWQKSLA